ncbi:Avt3p Ecym_8249 [Eremothecium cymbalariae DBVPG|uniref:Amino acid transporter transmembrane domain-containing protein n=1 Tax=Eremothecium cymbalariae (strain CBS 270.75 / DBVPG 7215 / KCTC 17166 / NRRL Y-17582) TaxID=931890 RepID=G8JXF8_ERECY|nr:Hypothetical protein Ecym_8249 [Eremothecium cymbalariae DBVPG\
MSRRPSMQLGSSVPSSRASVNVDWQNPDSVMLDIVNRHLAAESGNSLTLLGGDMTRDLYRWTSEQAAAPPPPAQQQQQQQQGVPPMLLGGRPASPLASVSGSSRRRSMSFSGSYAGTFSEMTANEMRAPNGFRRSYMLMNNQAKKSDFITRNFIEFLSLYGHFAGEDLSDDDDDDDGGGGGEGEGGLGGLGGGGRRLHRDRESVLLSDEEEPLLGTVEERSSSATRSGGRKGKASVFKTVLLLLKAFVGTGVLFMPKGFQNGGWLFSCGCLIFFGVVSCFCFLLLIEAKTEACVNGYGDLGRVAYGKSMQRGILASIVLSQIGFSAAYTIFTATNLQVFFGEVFGWSHRLSVYIFLQLVVYLPLALTRRISRLSGTALAADVLILFGLVYVYGYSAVYVLRYGVASQSMKMFNRQDWTLFVGTAIFTYEGIGLLVPIQESMSRPGRFASCLVWVIAAVTSIFISCGLLCYSAFGSRVETVILLNFPKDSVLSSSVQFLYAMAIMLSTPLQLFPAIRILEHGIISSSVSGKHDPRVKWAKNWFRVLVVFVTVSIAWVGADDLDKFVSLIGSFACVPLIYIYPPLLHYMLFKGTGRVSNAALFLDQLVVWFGVIGMFYTSSQTVKQWLQ